MEECSCGLSLIVCLVESATCSVVNTPSFIRTGCGFLRFFCSKVLGLTLEDYTGGSDSFVERLGAQRDRRHTLCRPQLCGLRNPQGPGPELLRCDSPPLHLRDLEAWS